MDDFLSILEDSLHNRSCLRAVLSGKRKDSAEPLQKLIVRPVSVRGREQYQLASRIDGKETHENVDSDEAVRRVRRLFGPTFENCHLFTPEADYSAHVRPNGTVKVKTGPPSRPSAPAGHDRAKNYLIPENVPCPFLAEIGVMTPAGKVRADKYHKFRQINRFLELVDDVVDDLPPEGPLYVVDFGCGKSYLTFATHYLLTEIRNREVHIVGLDRNPEVIRTCSRVAQKLGSRGLEFRTGDIADYEPEFQVNLAVSLHACDTATDAALAQAVGWNADAILAVPCCQHELLTKLHSPPLSPLEEHGILKERFAALATDALRSRALELCGYKTQVVEFIETEHTPKNLLIRAVRRPEASANEGDAASYRQFKQLLGVDRFALETHLGEDFLHLIAE